MSKEPSYGFTEKNYTQMNERHKETLASINELQNMEKQMHEQLNSGIANNTSTKDEQTNLVNRINELSTMRIDLFKNLGDVYENVQDNVAMSRNNLVQQLTTTKIVENELNNSKTYLDKLNDNKYNKLRMVEINAYMGDKYKAYAELLKLIVYVSLPILLIGLISKNNIIPDRYVSKNNVNDIFMVLILLILIVGGYYIVTKILDISSRSNMNFNEYEWDFDPVANRPSVIQYDEQQFKYGKDYLYSEGKKLHGETGGCYDSSCCDKGTKYDKKKKKCVINENDTKHTFSKENDTVKLSGDIKPYDNVIERFASA